MTNETDISDTPTGRITAPAGRHVSMTFTFESDFTEEEVLFWMVSGMVGRPERPGKLVGVSVCAYDVEPED